MNEPELKEEKLDRLLKCLVRNFIQQHGQNTHKLPEKAFYLTERMGCCKEAGLNYEYPSTTQDGDVVNIMSSAYVTAVKELERRGLVELTGSNLTFVLTNQGYDAGRSGSTKVGAWDFIKQWTNEHQGLIALVTLFATAVGVFIALRSM
ncbi:hypothetical protein [Stutzerimonas decontaminans]|uniref:hypothetical protein n=1 Tax=Stutzerimonas decontaminans TaxID=3022791 RepID=UPI0011AF0A90|nr:hypothetical protein [Stutzerimonas decontaminans]MCQ4243904.1 hypothetical protein [Stutzerimonas decontaminans]